MRYLLDTDICIFFLQGKFNIKEKIKGVGISNCYISEITIAELKFGAMKSSNIEKHTKEVEKMEELFSVIPIYNSLDNYAIEKVKLQNLIPDFDLLIGVTAVSNSLVLVSNNERHLKRISHIELENWTKT